MTCDQTCFQLNALADRELNPWQAWRIRRHLAACPACAAQLVDIQRLDTTVRAWRDIPAPAGLDARIAALHSAAPNVVLRPLPIRPAAVGLASLAAALAALFWFLPGQPGQPAIAFADVERAMQQVKTISWEHTMAFYDQKGHLNKGSTSHFTEWVRRNPPAFASRGVIPHLGNVRDLTDARGELFQSPTDGYEVFDLRHKAQGYSIEKKMQDTVRQVTNPQSSGGLLGNVPGNQIKYSPMNQRHVILEGQDRILFTRNQEIIAPRKQGPANHYLFHIKIWADPVTHYVVRIENHSVSGGAWPEWMVDVQSNFHYNQPSPPGVFDWSPPPGAKITDRRKTKTS